MLSFRYFNGSGANVVLLHGLFGMGANLNRLARWLSTDFSVYTIDLPDHGSSSWLQSRNIVTYSEIIMDWMMEIDIQSCYLLGHSLGGKVAMQIASANPSFVESLIVVDILPIAYPDTHAHIFKAMDEVASSRCTSRQDANMVMKRHISELEVIQFLSMSLLRGKNDILAWKLNHKGLARDYSTLRSSLNLGSAAFEGPVLFVKGDNSSYIPGDSLNFIKSIFPNSELVTIPQSSHWVHADNPGIFNSVVREFFLASKLPKVGPKGIKSSQ